MNNLTVEMLIDVVDSQLIVHGNRALFVRNMVQGESGFMLFAGEGVDFPLLECASKNDVCSEEFGLQSLHDKLNELDGTSTIHCSDDSRVLNGFEIGFKAENRFVLTLDSTELVQPTVVVDG